jgi:hypothetical protein
MSKRTSKFVVVPTNVWETEQLSLVEKAVLIEIDSVANDCPSPSSIAKTFGISLDEVREAVKSLSKKGALDVRFDEVGKPTYITSMYKEDYSRDESKISVEGVMPTGEKMDYEYIAEMWQKICPELPQPTKITTKRRRKMHAAIKGNDFTQNNVIQVFRLVHASDFLSGRRAGTTWTATFDWVFKSPDIMRKIFEGGYCYSPNEKESYKQIMDTNPIAGEKPKRFVTVLDDEFQ